MSVIIGNVTTDLDPFPTVRLPPHNLLAFRIYRFASSSESRQDEQEECQELVLGTIAADDC